MVLYMNILNRNIIRKNLTSVSVVLFLSLFILVQYIKPSFLYDTDGSLRQFGIGTRKKTILPCWLITIILAILSYLFMLYYLNIPKLS